VDRAFSIADIGQETKSRRWQSEPCRAESRRGESRSQEKRWLVRLLAGIKL